MTKIFQKDKIEREFGVKESSPHDRLWPSLPLWMENKYKELCNSLDSRDRKNDS